MLYFIAFLVGAGASFLATMIYHKRVLQLKNDALSVRDTVLAQERLQRNRARLELSEAKLTALKLLADIKAEYQKLKAGAEHKLDELLKIL